MRTGRLLVFVLTISMLASVFMHVQPAAAQTTLNVVSLGDSYTAGNGAKNYYGPTDCYRSRDNYSEQYIDLLKRHANVNYTNLACSGAVTGNVASQIAQNVGAVKSADLILMSVGGNDMNFAGIVVNCWGRVDSSCSSLVDAIGEGDLTATANKAVSAIRAVRSTAKNARIVLVGYPDLLGCNKTLDLTPGPNEYPIGRKLASAQARYEQLIQSRINGMRFGEGLDVRYVSLRNLYDGHEYCGGKELWLFKPLSSASHMEWFHPNFAGHNASALHLYKEKVHAGLLDSTQPSPQPAPQPSRPANSYSNLPFKCGVVLPHVSTYDRFGSFVHGEALDMPMPVGTPVVAPASGKVQVYYQEGGYGRFVDVIDGSGTTHRFAHLQVNVPVSSGQHVNRGQKIGSIGMTGITTGPHLHYEHIRGGSKVAINLGGPELQWGPRQDSGGFRITKHRLVSGNCPGTSYGGGSSQPRPRGYEDLLIWERTSLRYARSDGRDSVNWEPFVDGITNPTRSDSCEFDGDRFTEYLSYEKHLKQFAIGNPKPGGGFEWTVISRNHPNVDNFACVDWNRDGKEDIWMRNTKGKIQLGISDGRKIREWRVLVGGIAHLSHLDACDINGDGQDEIVAYEPGIKQMRVAVRVDNRTMRWRQLLPGIGKISGMACGNFNPSHKGDETIVWQPEQNGRYVIGEFGSNYSRIHWDPLRPTGLSRPFESEISAGDIDDDGRDELLVNEYRPNRGNHSIMVADFDGRRHFKWYPFIEGITARNVEVGHFVD